MESSTKPSTPRFVQPPTRCVLISGNKQRYNGSIPRYEFEFIPFDQVPGKLGDSTQLIDIVGKIATISRKQTLSIVVEKIDLIINDENANEMTVTLWQEQAKEFEEKVTEHPNSSHCGDKHSSQIILEESISGINKSKKSLHKH